MTTTRQTSPHWLQLCFIGLAAIILLTVCTELVARRLFTESRIKATSCLVLDDPLTGVRAKPNSVCVQKDLESKWVEYRYNACGHRDPKLCNVKAPETYRIVLVGSSIAEGYTVRQDQSYAAVLPILLSRETGRKVEVYDEAMEWGSPRGVYLRFHEALEAKPDLILWTITPWDILNEELTTPALKHSAAEEGANEDAPTTETANATPSNAGRGHGLWANLTRKRSLSGFLTTHSRAFFMIQHYLYESDTIYVGHSLAPDQYTPSLQDRPTQDWQAKLARFDTYFADMAARAHDAGVPFAVGTIPRHAQAVMISSGNWPPNLDPYSFGDQIKAIVEKHGGVYVDDLHELRNTPEMNAWFYPVDQHMTVEGQRGFANVLAQALTRGEIPALKTQSHLSATLTRTR